MVSFSGKNTGVQIGNNSGSINFVSTGEAGQTGLAYSGEDVSKKERYNYDFSGVNLSGKKLIGVFNGNFKNCDLSEAKLSGLFKGNFRGCDLSGAKLTNIFNGNFEDCNLSGAELSGVFEGNFRGCRVNKNTQKTGDFAGQTTGEIFLDKTLDGRSEYNDNPPSYKEATANSPQSNSDIPASTPNYIQTVSESSSGSNITFSNGKKFSAQNSVNTLNSGGESTVYMNNGSKFTYGGKEYNKKNYPNGLTIDGIKFEFKHMDSNINFWA